MEMQTSCSTQELPRRLDGLFPPLSPKRAPVIHDISDFDDEDETADPHLETEPDFDLDVNVNQSYAANYQQEDGMTYLVQQ